MSNTCIPVAEGIDDEAMSRMEIGGWSSIHSSLWLSAECQRTLYIVMMDRRAKIIETLRVFRRSYTNGVIKNCASLERFCPSNMLASTTRNINGSCRALPRHALQPSVGV